MADNLAALPVRTPSGTQLDIRLVDTGGTNVASVSAGGALKVDNSGVTQPDNVTQWGTVAVTGAAAIADGAALATAPKVGAVAMAYNGATDDMLRTTTATDGHAANTITGALNVGVGPGWTRRFSPANLGTASNSAVTNDVNGAGTLALGIGTTTTGTMIIEVTADGTTWVTAVAYDIVSAVFVSAAFTPTIGHVYLVSVNGMDQARIRTASTLGATVANVWTFSAGDVIQLAPSTAATGAVNLTQVGGSSISLGQAAMAASLPVVIASNQTNLPANITQYNGNNVITAGANGAFAVGGTAASAATKTGNPVGIGGVFTTAQPTVTTGQIVDLQATARGALIVAVGVDGFAVTGTVTTTPPANASTNIAQIGGNATITAGANGAMAVGGTAASAATKTGNPIGIGGVFTTAQPTVTTGQIVDLQATARGALIVAPGVDGFAITGTVTATVTGVATAANQTNVQVADNAAFTDGTTTLGMAGFIFDEVAGTALTENDAAAARIDAKRALVGTIEDATTRGQRAAVTAAGGLGSNILSVGGTAVVAAGTGQAVPNRLTDGTAYYTKTGQAAGTASFAQLSDQTNTASIIATINALKTDMSSIVGAVPGATNALPVRLTDGAAFYSGASSAPTSPHFLAATSAALGAGANTSLNYFVTSGKTGRLAGFDVASTVPLKVEIQTKLTGTGTTRTILFLAPFVGLQYRTPYPTYITQASADGTTGFSLKLTNVDPSVAADVYGTGFWDEV